MKNEEAQEAAQEAAQMRRHRRQHRISGSTGIAAKFEEKDSVQMEGSGAAASTSGQASGEQQSEMPSQELEAGINNIIYAYD